MDKPVTLGLMFIAVAAMGVVGLITASASADKTLTCDTTKDCNLIIHKLRVGDDLIVQFKATAPPANTGGGGTTTPPASTVDQQARDDISQLKSVDITQNNELNRLAAEHTSITANYSALSDKITAQANEIEMLKAQIANISTVNPIVDINVTHPGQNVTQPPVSNETTPVPPVENNTTPIPPVSNETIPVPPTNETIPPVANETTPPVTNETQPIPPIDNGTVVVPPDNGTIITPPGNETVVVPPSNGTVIVPPENATVTPPANETVITPPGNETGVGNGSDGLQATHPIVCASNEFYNTETNTCEPSSQ